MKRFILFSLLFSSTMMNAQNRVEVMMNDGSVQTHPTSSVERIHFGQGNDFTITTEEGETITFNGTASNIRFIKNHAIDGTSVQTITQSLGLGWNLGNNLDAQNNGYASETAWGNRVATLKTFQAVKAAGFSSVRIPITWMGHIGNAPDYKIEEKYMNRVAEVVGYAKDAGLKAIINIHHDGADSKYWLDILGASKSEERNTQVKNQFAAIWKQIAERFKQEGDYLIFEAMNEIHDGNWGWGENRTDGGKQYRIYFKHSKNFFSNDSTISPMIKNSK